MVLSELEIKSICDRNNQVVGWSGHVYVSVRRKVQRKISLIRKLTLSYNVTQIRTTVTGTVIGSEFWA